MKQVICLGSFQGTDRIGWDIAAALEQRLSEQGSENIRVRSCASPAQLPGMLADTEALLIVDALAGVPAGTVQAVDPKDLQSAPAWSSHGVDLVMALDLARTLGDLPAQVRIVGIGVGDARCDSGCGSGQDAAPTVEAVLPAVWSVLVAEFAL